MSHPGGFESTTLGKQVKEKTENQVLTSSVNKGTLASDERRVTVCSHEHHGTVWALKSLHLTRPQGKLCAQGRAVLVTAVKKNASQCYRLSPRGLS